MTPREFKKLQAQKLAEQRAKPHQKISNTFIDNAITQANANAIKVTFYLASILEKGNEDYSNDLITINIDMTRMLKYIEVTAPEIRRTLKQMQQTSISFINEELKEELMINLLPYIDFKWGKNEVEIKLFTKIAKLIVDVKNNYTFINTKTLMSLRNKHSLRLLPFLNMINGYDKETAKRKRLDLDAINDLFGTNLKNLYEIERKILAPVKEELDMNSKLTFVYETNFDNFGRGRPKATTITIDVVDNSKSLFAQ